MANICSKAISHLAISSHASVGSKPELALRLPRDPWHMIERSRRCPNWRRCCTDRQKLRLCSEVQNADPMKPSIDLDLDYRLRLLANGALQ